MKIMYEIALIKLPHTQAFACPQAKKELVQELHPYKIKVLWHGTYIIENEIKLNGGEF